MDKLAAFVRVFEHAGVNVLAHQINQKITPPPKISKRPIPAGWPEDKFSPPPRTG